MSPRICFLLSKFIITHEKYLAKIGFILVVSFIIVIFYFSNAESEATQLFLAPFLVIPALVFGAIFLYAFFGNYGVYGQCEFSELWKEMHVISKLRYWSLSIFFSVWFFGIIFVSIFGTIKAIFLLDVI